MDLTKCLVNPEAVDDVRQEFEAELAEFRIADDSSIEESIAAMADFYGHRSIAFEGPAGTFGVCMFEESVMRQLLRCDDLEHANPGRLLYQALALWRPSVVVGFDKTDVAIAARCVLPLGNELDPPVYRDAADRDVSLRRFGGATQLNRLKNCREVHIRRSSHTGMHNWQTYRVPDTYDVQNLYVRSRVRTYAKYRDLDEQDIDPVNTHWVHGLEHMHVDEQPSNWQYVEPSKRSDVLRWIQSTFEDAASVRSCPGSSYGLKHRFEAGGRVAFDEWDGIQFGYLTNGQFKGAMIAAGYLPDDSDKLNPVYPIKLRTRARAPFKGTYGFARFG